MPMIKIFRVCPAPGYTQKFREKHGLQGKPFAEQIKILQSENLLLPGGFPSCMEKLGCEVFDCLYDDFQLQAQWAEENGAVACFRGTNPLYDVLRRQVEAFQPDVILLWAGAFFRLDSRRRNELRQLCKKKVIVTGFWGDEIPHKETYAGYFGDLDFIFTSNRGYQRHFDAAGIKAYLVGASFDNTISHTPPSGRSHDLVFSGDTGFGTIDHIRRYEWLREIAAKTDVEIYANERPLHPLRQRYSIIALDTLALLPSIVLAVLSRLTRLPIIRRLPFSRLFDLAALVKRTGVGAKSFYPKWDHPLNNYFNKRKQIKKLFPKKVSKGPLETSKYYELLAQSKIVLNLHRDEEEDYGNIRCFEATGVGTCLLTDRGAELSEFFDVGNEIVAFTDVEDCLRKVRYLLDHPKERERIAANGQRRTLAQHTIMHRCEVMAAALRKEMGQSARQRSLIYATYDVGRYPISYDIAFFVEAAEIMRRMNKAQGTIVNILYPADISRIPGVSAEADAAVDKHGRAFRITHICGQIARLFPTVSVNEVKDRDAFVPSQDPGVRLIHLPSGELPHHTEYYRMVNANPGLVRGFTASTQALRYVDEWLSTFVTARKRLITISVRDYAFDKQRNSKLDEWKKFAESLDPEQYEVVIVPDTDQISTYEKSVLAKYRPFWFACFDVDLRYALYERAYLNFFVNNGPATMASLNRNIRYLTFKLVAPGVPHCTEEFIVWQGFKLNGSPAYGTKFQKWVWEDDDFPVILREFHEMAATIEKDPGERETAGHWKDSHHSMQAGTISVP